MKFKELSNTGIKLSQICLGTMTWGEQNSLEEAKNQMDMALDYDINFFDTAELYPVPPDKNTYAKTEEYIGKWLTPQKREKIFLATKIAGKAESLTWIRKGKNQFDAAN